MIDRNAPLPELLAKTETLIEALPYLQRYAGQTFVVKYGGHAMGDDELAQAFAEDIVLLKAVGINPVVVHGGGPQIGAMLKRLGIVSEFVDGLRVTDGATAEVAEMVLAGSINKEIVAAINRAGGLAAGISGKDANLVTAVKVTRTVRDPDSRIEAQVDLGFVGEPATIDRTLIDTLIAAGITPVIAPVAAGTDGHTYNINADTMAGRDCRRDRCGAVLPADRCRGRARRARRPADQPRPIVDCRTGCGRHHLGRDDPQDRNLRRGSRGGRRCGGHPRRARAARHAAGNLHPARCRHAGPRLTATATMVRRGARRFIGAFVLHPTYRPMMMTSDKAH